MADEWRSDDWSTLWDADASRRVRRLMRNTSPVEARPRIHLDLFVDTADVQTREVDRFMDCSFGSSLSGAAPA